MWATIVKNPALGVCAVLGLACALLFGLERYRSAQLDAARAELQVAQGNFTTAIEANKNLSAALDQLRGAHSALIETVRADTAAIERAATEVKVEAQAIRGTARALRAQREEIIRADPNCAELARIDIAAVCPALARSLREQAGRQRRDDARNPDSGSGSTTF